jgi:phosphatidylglycerophosphate synthase
MIGKLLRDKLTKSLFLPIGKLLSSFDPNHITALTYPLAALAAYFIATHAYGLAAVFVALSSFIDNIDGAVAKANNKKTAFGSYWDAFTDKMQEGSLLLGFFFKRANNQGAVVGVAVGLLVILWLTLSNMTTFKVTDQTLAALRDSGVNTELVQKVATMKGKTVRGKGEFFNQMEDIMGRRDANQYKTLILENAESSGIFPLALSSSVHPFAISVFGNLAVLLVGWLASFFWPAPTEEELRRTTWWTSRWCCTARPPTYTAAPATCWPRAAPTRRPRTSSRPPTFTSSTPSAS